MIRAIIVEDEVRSQQVLQKLLKMACPEVSVIGIQDNITSGVQLIQNTQPDLLFLDIQLKDGLGFSILETLDPGEIPAVIFTTAFDQYAIKAFRFSAVDYLLKPIELEELKKAIQKSKLKIENGFNHEQFKTLMHNLNSPKQEAPILTISTSDTIEYIRINEILRCEASGAYSSIILLNGRKIFISKVIKELEILLFDYNFFRIHQTHLINLSEVSQYFKTENSVIMSDQSSLPLARSRKEGFFGAMNKFRV